MFISFHGDESVGPSDLFNITSQVREVGADTVQADLLLRVTDSIDDVQSDTNACANGVCSLNWSPVKPNFGS
ncbi:MAG: hypothetical protein K2X93_00700 [Candidatus Obscuribacterales bacterium]|nr:hypothetical protein [Candidatus Obscuribacterales bacterium]